MLVGFPALLVTLLYLSTVVGLRSLAEFPRLHQAAETGDLETIRALVSGGQHVDSRIDHSWGGAFDDATPLMIASFYGQRHATELLLAMGADKSLVDKRGRCAADYAFDGGHVEIISLLSKR
jgi:Meckel syndrome type 1 protein